LFIAANTCHRRHFFIANFPNGFTGKEIRDFSGRILRLRTFAVSAQKPLIRVAVSFFDRFYRMGHSGRGFIPCRKFTLWVDADVFIFNLRLALLSRQPLNFVSKFLENWNA
jgi:hypothetical protein